ncbi:MAG: ankyrin repeat domain-containing protein [Desulfobacteraceae bacterium]|nr:ankyrin repeat domain-containing protein [Desulfobacteraceae bacterium]
MNDTSTPRDEAFEYVSFFLKKGFDINSIGFDGYTSLHAAILFNQPKDVAFLLERGADKNVKVGYRRIYGKNEKTKLFGMTALELANTFSKKDNQDRSEIIKMLTAKK